jgi:hypothetical protein
MPFKIIWNSAFAGMHVWHLNLAVVSFRISKNFVRSIGTAFIKKHARS